LFSRLQTAYENLPQYLQQGVLEWNKTSLKLENGSSVVCAATSASAIRGGSYNFLLLDEFAYLPQNIAEEFYASTYPTISSGTTSKIVIVSTPHGLNHYYNLWVNACRPKDHPLKNKFVPVEISWRDVPLYPGGPNRDDNWKQETIANTSEEQFNQETAYNEKINALEAKQAEVRRQQLRKQAIAEKANASFQLIIGTGTAVAKNLANPPAIIAILALAAAQLSIIAATPIPEFAKGVVGLQGAGTETSDSIHAKLSKGESVITAKATRANKDALTAMNNGEYEKFVAQKYIMPALEVRREKQRNSFAENISRSMQSSTYDDSLLIHETRKNKAVSIRNADQIGKATARELGRNSYFKNRV
jgi:hypothetical protein